MADAPKSAYDIAIERLRAADPAGGKEKPLTAAQKEEIAECRGCLQVAIDESLRQPPASHAPLGFGRRLEARLPKVAEGHPSWGLHATGILLVLGSGRSLRSTSRAGSATSGASRYSKTS